jgi:hypothetical protein
MSTPTIARTDKSTQTTPPPETALSPGTVPPPGTAPPGTAPSPGTTPAKKHDFAPYSPAPSLLHPEHQTNEISESSAGNATSPAQPGVKSPPKEIPLLGTVPDDFGPAYDYLGKVKELADEIEPGLYETYFEERFTYSCTKIGFHSRTGPDTLFFFGNSPKWSLEPIRELQQNFDSAGKQGHTLELVEAINKAGVQAIGMAFNVNPCFFAAHLLPKDNTCQWTDNRTNWVEDSSLMYCLRAEWLVSKRMVCAIGLRVIQTMRPRKQIDGHHSLLLTIVELRLVMKP